MQQFYVAKNIMQKNNICIDFPLSLYTVDVTQNINVGCMKILCSVYTLYKCS